MVLGTIVFFPSELSELSELGVVGTRYGGLEAVPGRIPIGRREAPAELSQAARSAAKLFSTARSAAKTSQYQLIFLTNASHTNSISTWYHFTSYQLVGNSVTTRYKFKLGTNSSHQPDLHLTPTRTNWLVPAYQPDLLLVQLDSYQPVPAY